ncbi:MAG: InlB B-repeat-containing protein, partial [Lachnospiraceae bacterium]|nr:InlB B-repeat-containing protein [Lachnospiraceae bacterium]
MKRKKLLTKFLAVGLAVSFAMSSATGVYAMEGNADTEVNAESETDTPDETLPTDPVADPAAIDPVTEDLPDGSEETDPMDPEVQDITVTFNIDPELGTAPALTVKSGAIVSLPSPTVKDGCTFVGWKISGTEWVIKPGDTVTVMTGLDTFDAVIEGTPTTSTETPTPEKVTVTFNVDPTKGEAIPSIEADEGTTYELTAPVAKNGYTFVGWQVEGLSSLIEAGTTVDIAPGLNEFTAVFEESDEITVIFHVDEEKGEQVGSITVPQGTTFEVTAPVAKNGWKFVGWKVEGAENLITEGIQVQITPGLNEFTAVFEETDTLEVIFHVDETKGEPVGSINVPNGAVFDVTAPVAKNGWKFVGWKVEGAENLITEGIQVQITPGLNEFTAVFEETDTLEVIFHVDETKGEPVGSINVPNGAVFDVTAPVAKNGWKFVGWKVEGAETLLTEGMKVHIAPGLNEFTAVFEEADTLEVIFYVDEKKGEPVGSINVPQGTVFEVTAPVAKNGWKFVGWKVEGVETLLTEGMKVHIAPGLNEFTAVFEEADELEVIFHVDEKKGEPVGSITVPKGTVFDVTAPVAKNGWKFVGWKVEGAETLLTEGMKVHVAPGLNEFTAVFEEADEITVTFHVDETKGEPVGSITVPKGTIFDVTAPVAKPGWKFVGWKVEGAETLLTAGVQVHIAPELCEFTAVFEEDVKEQRTITITINAGENGAFSVENAGKPIVYEGISETSDEVFTLPEVKADNGYEFAGWFVQGNEEAHWAKDVTTFKAAGLAKFLEGSQVGYITITAEYKKAEEPSTEPTQP